MTIELLTNRYNQTTATHIQPNGCSISTPVYCCPTQDQVKLLLNAFREVVRQQRLEMGHSDAPTPSIGVSVTTATKPPMTAAEEELGMSEESLRYALFQRKGTPERLIIKFQQLTGVELITREAIVSNLNAWLDALEMPDENERPKTTRKTSKTTKTATTSATASRNKG